MSALCGDKRPPSCLILRTVRTGRNWTYFWMVRRRGDYLFLFKVRLACRPAHTVTVMNKLLRLTFTAVCQSEYSVDCRLERNVALVLWLLSATAEVLRGGDLLLLLLSSSSTPLYRVFILIFLRQTVSLGNTVLQLFCCYYSWCLYR